MKTKSTILLILIFQFGNSYAQNKIIIPEIMSGNNINLVLDESEKEFFPGFKTKTLGYNGNHLGKTIILNKGQNVNFNVTNNLDEITTTHWHGLHVSPSNDGSPHTPIAINNTWSPSFEVRDKAGTYWYHPHLHEKTLKQVVKGAAGMIIVHDEEENALNIPKTYGVDDIPLIFQFQTFDNNKQIVEDDEADNAMLVNGTVNGFMDLPAQMIRLRLLNASSHRVFRFGFEGDLQFAQIGSDAGLLDKPVTMARLNLAPGERAEILVDLSNKVGNVLKLKTYGSELPTGFPGGPAMMGMQGGPLDNKINEVMTINVIESNSHPIHTKPVTLTSNHIWYENGAINRDIRLTAQPMMSMDNFFINNGKYDENVINFKTKKDRIETWTITNQTMMAHPFHIHGNHFYVISINGMTPPENMKGRKDVVMIPPMNGSIKLITKYEDFADDHMPYMYHCHILSHEDNGMMGQFIIEENTTSVNENELEKNFNIVKNNNSINIVSLADGQIISIFINDISGKEVYRNSTHQKETFIDTKDYISGIYIVTVNTKIGIFSKKILIN